ncbi:hypothetical protein SNEBB_005385 [Seison nebaliae]|nr:hypothetical protein SNEBB_005385 [Seison nebaliae]
MNRYDNCKLSKSNIDKEEIKATFKKLLEETLDMGQLDFLFDSKIPIDESRKIEEDNFIKQFNKIIHLQQKQEPAINHMICQMKQRPKSTSNLRKNLEALDINGSFSQDISYKISSPWILRKREEGPFVNAQHINTTLDTLTKSEGETTANDPSTLTVINVEQGQYDGSEPVIRNGPTTVPFSCIPIEFSLKEKILKLLKVYPNTESPDVVAKEPNDENTPVHSETTQSLMQELSHTPKQESQSPQNPSGTETNDTTVSDDGGNITSDEDVTGVYKISPDETTSMSIHPIDSKLILVTPRKGQCCACSPCCKNCSIQ